MNKKTLFLINGVSTVGKTTLAEKLMANFEGIIYPICNYTTRMPRDSDDSRLILPLSQKDYDQIGGFVSDEGMYKIAFNDINNFIDDTTKDIAIVNAAFSTIPQMKKSDLSDKIMIKSCLMRFCDDIDHEKEILTKRIENYFQSNKTEVQRRTKLFSGLIDNYTHNEDFVKNNVDIIFTHENHSANEVFQAVSEFLKLK